MRKSFVLLATFLLGTLSATAQAQNYYVCDNGDDSNDGRSEARPFKSIEKANETFRKMNGGDSVLFCRGGTFQQTKSIHLLNRNCSASEVCTIGDYGDDNLSRPVLVSNGESLLQFREGKDATPDGGYHVKNLILMGDSKSKANGIDLFNEVNDLTVENLHIEGFRIGIRSAGALTLGPGANGKNDRLLVKNSTIINNYYQGFYGSCNDCLISNNVFENNGYAQRILTHNIYLGSGEPAAKGMKLKNNLLYKSTHYDGKCSGVSLVVHGKFDGLVIDGNTIKEDKGKTTGHCWGIAIDPGYAHEDEYFLNTVIKNNKLINMGNVGIGCSSCKGLVIEGNEIIDEGKELTAGIKIPTKTENSVKSDDVTIRNNKIILNHLTGNGISLGGENKFNVINNDIKLPVDTKTDCFDKYDANINTDTAKNICALHNGVSIIDITEEETDISENTPQEPVQESPVVTGSETEVVENMPQEPVQEEPVVTDSETEVVENMPQEPVQEEPVVTDSETEVVENMPQEPVQGEPVVTEPETEVVNSGNNSNETVTTFQRPSWAAPRPVGSSNFTIDSLKEALQNDYGSFGESECRMFARGRCIIR